MSFNYNIPTPKCFVIREFIASMIKTEFANQLVRQPAKLIYGLKVLTEHTTPYDLDNKGYITVSLGNLQEISSNADYQRFNATYEIWVNNTVLQDSSVVNQDASEQSNKEIKEIALAIRYILQAKENYEYPVGACPNSKRVKSIDFTPIFKDENTRSESISLITFEVEYSEPVGEQALYPITGSDGTIDNDVKHKENYT